MWTVPNLLTLARIVAVVPLVAFIDAGWWTAAFVLFIAAAVTDWLDGWLARRWNQQSDLGRMLDPIADKLIVAAVLVALVLSYEELAMVAAVAIISRELVVAGLREFLGPKGIVIHVSRLAKWKTAAQMLAIGLILGGTAFAGFTPAPGHGAIVGSAPYQISGAFVVAGWASMAVAGLLTWITAFAYLRAGLRHMEPPR